MERLISHITCFQIGLPFMCRVERERFSARRSRLCSTHCAHNSGLAYPRRIASATSDGRSRHCPCSASWPPLMPPNTDRPCDAPDRPPSAPVDDGDTAVPRKSPPARSTRSSVGSQAQTQSCAASVPVCASSAPRSPHPAPTAGSVPYAPAPRPEPCRPKTPRTADTPSPPAQTGQASTALRIRDTDA